MAHPPSIVKVIRYPEAVAQSPVGIKSSAYYIMLSAHMLMTASLWRPIFTEAANLGCAFPWFRVYVNILRAEFFSANINIYFDFLLFLDIDMAQVLKILPKIREGPTYSI